MPAWYDSSGAADAGGLADAVISAVEADQRGVYHPPLVRLLRVAHGISPQLGDAVMRVLRGPSAAPRMRS